MSRTPTSNPAAPRTQQPPLEPLAVASVVSAVVVGLCPFGALAAIILGSMGLRRIRNSQGAKRGTGLAWAGLALGVAIPALQLVALGWLQSHVEASIDRAAESSIVETLNGGDLPSGVWATTALGGPPTSAVQDFCKAVEAQLGGLREVRLTKRTLTEWPNSVIAVAFSADFERGTAFGNATFKQGPPADLNVTLLMQSLELDAGGVRTRVPETHADASKEGAVP